MSLVISFRQIDEDTYRSDPLESGSNDNDKFFDLIRRQGLDPNAPTRPREVPADDYLKSGKYAQASFVGAAGGIVCDESIMRALSEKGCATMTLKRGKQGYDILIP